MEGSASACQGVRIVSQRVVRPSPSKLISKPQTVHLTPWDLQMITVEYIQKSILLPKPSVGGEHLVDHLASSFARARFHPFASRLAIDQAGDGSITVSLQFTDEGAEFVHAVPPPEVTVVEVVSSLYVPRMVWSFFPLDGLVGADAVAGSCPVLTAKVTELADGMFIAMVLNHGITDGTMFWHLFNTWAEISRGDAKRIATPAPVLERWFPDTCSVPVPLPFAKLEHIVQRFHGPPVEECFFGFAAESIRNLKSQANDEMAGTATGNAISSLQSLLTHVWRSVTRARRLEPRQETSYTVLVGCRGRVKRVPKAHTGNAVVRCMVTATAGEVLDNGLGWTVWRLNRAVASQDEAGLLESTASWHLNPKFAYLAGWWHPAVLVTGNSPRINVLGNNFGWGSPVAVRSGSANKVDGWVTVYEGIGGGMGMEVCLAPGALARLVVDDEFMGTVVTSTRNG